MKNLIINFNNGFTTDVEVQDLNEAKEIAEEQMSYTQQNVTIQTEDGQVLAVSRWYGYEATEEEKEDGVVLAEFGNSGFYAIWEEEF